MITTILILGVQLHIEGIRRESFAKNGHAVIEECIACSLKTSDDADLP